MLLARLIRPAFDEEGFTLTELMVVLVILGLLATIVIINVLPAADQANNTKARADIATLESALEQYRLDNMTYPRSEQGLQALIAPPSDLAQPQRYRQGGYIRRLPNDPWGNAYIYVAPGTRGGGPFDIMTYGADGQPGGEAENADIGNWQ
ncbi:type II secretion system major pseudopilin GspG [Parasphingopyxis marina]|uniref:Type II secretion system core protein G n=1 Tax=Parasphingopyxis marina TaxID=2761622 RepID=A0A842HZU0_9SPHN|nr:type II secretion system major pseudopilin GspG [Parasphingopyxis marina]MBC2778077.1 type II secretion system major pseudopilin GspG [Parasphingopyxis marina]